MGGADEVWIMISLPPPPVVVAAVPAAVPGLPPAVVVPVGSMTGTGSACDAQ